MKKLTCKICGAAESKNGKRFTLQTMRIHVGRQHKQAVDAVKDGQLPEPESTAVEGNGASFKSPVAIACSYHLLLGMKISEEAKRHTQTILEVMRHQREKEIDQIKQVLAMLDGVASDESIVSGLIVNGKQFEHHGAKGARQ